MKSTIRWGNMMKRLNSDLLFALAVSALLMSGPASAAKVTGPVTCVPAGQEDPSKAWVLCTPADDPVAGFIPLPIPHNSHRFEVVSEGVAVVSDEQLSKPTIKIDYVEEEFFIEGTAEMFTSAIPLTADGMWNVQKVSGSAEPYKIRVLVKRPADPNKFNGTVVLEFSHLSSEDYGFVFMRDEIFDGGYAHALVSPLSGNTGEVDGLKLYDPTRYASMDVPGIVVDYGYDMFTQAAKEIRDPSPGSVDPMGGLKVERVIATGHSYGAAVLGTYINAVQPLEGAIDGFLPTDIAGAFPLNISEGIFTPPYPDYNKVRSDLYNAKVIRLNSEWSLMDNAVPDLNNVPQQPFLGVEWGTRVRQPDSDSYRGYEYSAGAHVNRDHYTRVGYLGFNSFQETISFLAFDTCLTEGNDGIASNQVHNAVLYQLNEWIRTGNPAPASVQMPIVVVDAVNGYVDFERDAVGNPLGGIRPVAVDVPIARYDGRFLSDPNTGGIFAACHFSGIKVALDQAKLDELYKNHGNYVSKVVSSARDLESTGFLRPYDKKKIENAAAQSDIGK